MRKSLQYSRDIEVAKRPLGRKIEVADRLPLRFLLDASHRGCTGNGLHLQLHSRWIGRKGQWFLISAIIISGSLLTMSIIFKNYFVVDTSEIAKLNEDYLALDLENQFAKIITMGYDQPACTALRARLDQFKEFSMKKVSERGYLLEITYAVDCVMRRTNIDISLSSDEMRIEKTITL